MMFWKSVTAALLCLCLSACGGAPAGEPAAPAAGGGTAAAPAPEEQAAPPDPDAAATVVTCRIVDGAEEGSLLLAELDGGFYRGTGVYRLSLEGIPVTLDGQAADASVLEDGMPVEIAFNGSVLESFPAQFGQVYSLSAWSRGQGKNGMGGTYDLCGLYLQVLDDLWQRDPALNEGITQIALDLSQAPGELTEGEKAALVWRFGELHGADAFAATFAELEDQGCIRSEPLGNGAPEGAAFFQWEDGCLFSITPSAKHEGEVYSLPVLFFNAEKWRSSLGAYVFSDCSAGWSQAGTWSGYQIGGEMIS